MLHVSLSAPSHAARSRVESRPVISAPTYVRLRRLAAGVTVAQAAARMSTTAAEREDAALLLEMLEAPGARAKHRATIEALRRAFPIDVAVYFQLAEDPVASHPRVCVGCGCSEWDPCTHGADGHDACAWAGEAICTGCVARDPSLAAELAA